MARDVDDDEVLCKKNQNKTKRERFNIFSQCSWSPTKQLHALWQMPSSPNDLTSVGEPYLVLIDVRNKTVSFTWITESCSDCVCVCLCVREIRQCWTDTHSEANCNSKGENKTAGIPSLKQGRDGEIMLV